MKTEKKEKAIDNISYQEDKKENEKLSKYIGKSSNKLKLDLGEPNEDYKKENGNYELVYKTKKFGIPCERKFEINSKFVVIGFVSNGCF